MNHSLACAFLSRLYSSRTVCEPFSRLGQQQWRRQQEGSLRETAAAYKCQIYPGFLAATMEHASSMSTITWTFYPSLREVTCQNHVSSVCFLKTSYVPRTLERRRRRFSGGGDCDFHFLCRCQIPAFPFPSPPSKKNLEPTSEGGEAAHATRLAHIRESLVLPADATTKRQRTTTFPSYKDSKDREELKSGPQVARQSSLCHCVALHSK